MASVQIRVQEELADKIENAKWEIKYKLRLEIQNADVLNALLFICRNSSRLLSSTMFYPMGACNQGKGSFEI